METTSVFSPLIGQAVKTIYINDGSLIIITRTNNRYCFKAVGGCCSESYFHSIDNLIRLLTGEVVSVEDIEVDKCNATPKRQKHVIQYEYKIGVMIYPGDVYYTTITMRNESNGYYGGEVECVEWYEILPEIIKGMQKLDNWNTVKDWVNPFS